MSESPAINTPATRTWRSTLIPLGLFLNAALLIVIAVLVSTGFATLDSSIKTAVCELQNGNDVMAREVCLAPLR